MAARKTSTTKASKTPSKATLAEEQEVAERRARLEAEAEAALAAVTYEEDGVAVIPASKGADPANQFRFRIAGGPDKLWSLPNLQYIPLAEAMGFENKSTAEAMRSMFDRYIPDILEHVDATQLMALSQAWKKHSSKGGQTEVSVGESKLS